jgi:hypothetical protein
MVKEEIPKRCKKEEIMAKEWAIYFEPTTYIKLKIRGNAKKNSITELIKKASELLGNRDLLEVNGKREK